MTRTSRVPIERPEAGGGGRPTEARTGSGISSAAGALGRPGDSACRTAVSSRNGSCRAERGSVGLRCCPSLSERGAGKVGCAVPDGTGAASEAAGSATVGVRIAWCRGGTTDEASASKPGPVRWRGALGGSRGSFARSARDGVAGVRVSPLSPPGARSCIGRNLVDSIAGRWTANWAGLWVPASVSARNGVDGGAPTGTIGKICCVVACRGAGIPPLCGVRSPPASGSMSTSDDIDPNGSKGPCGGLSIVPAALSLRSATRRRYERVVMGSSVPAPVRRTVRGARWASP
jgi:hypothetical protein